MNIDKQTHYARFTMYGKTITIIGISEEDVRLQLATLSARTISSDIKIQPIVKNGISELDIQNKAEEVKEATSFNNHTEAYRLICEFLGLEDMVKKLVAIQEVQAREGYLPQKEYAKRREIYDYMCHQGRLLLGEDVFNKYFYQNT